MSKAILISIRHKWNKKIFALIKHIEVRKSAPKCGLPVKVYIYEPIENGNGCGKVVAEFVCDTIQKWKWEPDAYEEAEGGEFAYNILTVDGEKTGMEYDELVEYGQGKTLYGWHISNLTIYDRPKEMSEFKNRQIVWRGQNHIHAFEAMKRPPQSWCYIEEQEG